MPLPKAWTAATRWVAECSSEMTRRASPSLQRVPRCGSRSHKLTRNPGRNDWPMSLNGGDATVFRDEPGNCSPGD